MNVTELRSYSASNFFATICTPWQIKGVEVAINRLRASGKKITATIFLLNHDITGRIISTKDCPLMSDVEWIEIDSNEFCKIYKEFGSIQRLKLSIKNSTYSSSIFVFCSGEIEISWLYVISAAFQKKVVVILGDDGVGSYLGYENVKKLKTVKLFITSYLVSRLYRSNNIIDNRLLQKRAGKYIRNEEIAKEYEKVLFKSDRPISKEIDDVFSGKIIINTQCLFDNGQINGEQDLNTLQCLYEALGSLNKMVVIKPHPRELSLYRYEKFGWKVIKGINITQEELFAKLSVKPKMVVGIYSSTLINIKALFGVNTVSLAKIFMRENISEGEKKMCDDFIKEFDGLVGFPNNNEEIKEFINDISTE